jgi:dihydrofolate reductase
MTTLLMYNESMKVILVMVQTLNSKITRGDDPHITTWTSTEDHDFFISMLEKHDLIVMGSGTYDAARESIKPDGKKRRIILTSQPKRYEEDELPGEIEFSSETPKELIDRLEKEGYDEMLLVGGGETNRLFFEAGVVTDLYLSLEPRLFGKGKSMVTDGEFDIAIKLVELKQLNDKGTLLLHYSIT